MAVQNIVLGLMNYKMLQSVSASLLSFSIAYAWKQCVLIMCWTSLLVKVFVALNVSLTLLLANVGIVCSTIRLVWNNVRKKDNTIKIADMVVQWFAPPAWPELCGFDSDPGPDLHVVVGSTLASPHIGKTCTVGQLGTLNCRLVEGLHGPNPVAVTIQ